MNWSEVEPMSPSLFQSVPLYCSEEAGTRISVMRTSSLLEQRSRFFALATEKRPCALANEEDDNQKGESHGSAHGRVEQISAHKPSMRRAGFHMPSIRVEVRLFMATLEISEPMFAETMKTTNS